MRARDTGSQIFVLWGMCQWDVPGTCLSQNFPLWSSSLCLVPLLLDHTPDFVLRNKCLAAAEEVFSGSYGN